MISDKGGAGRSKLIFPLRRKQWTFKSNSSLKRLALVSFLKCIDCLAVETRSQKVNSQLSKRTYLLTSLFGSFKTDVDFA